MNCPTPENHSDNGGPFRYCPCGWTETAPDPSAKPEVVHNHPPYRPPCNERMVDGRLQGACLAETAPDPSERAGEELTDGERKRFWQAVCEWNDVDDGFSALSPSNEILYAAIERILADRMAARAGEVAEVLRQVVDDIEVNGIDEEHPGSAGWCHKYVERLIDALTASGLVGGRADELHNLRRWKAEATEVMDGWTKVWDYLGRPGELGQSIHEATLQAVQGWADKVRAKALRGLREACEQAEARESVLGEQIVTVRWLLGQIDRIESGEAS